MRNNNIFFLFILALVLASCGKDYLDINQANPNQTQNPPINALLANVTYQTGINVNRAGNVTAYYTQQLASPNASSGSDVYENVDRSALWLNIYDIIEDSRKMEAIAVERNAYQHIGVAKITNAMNMSLLIDFFGNVPYSQAWNPNIFKPAYDDAPAVYDSCLQLLDDGIAALQQANPGIVLDPANDLVHGGATDEKAAWIKTAYALKARLLNRLGKLPAYDPAAILTALGNAYTSNSDDAQLTRFVNRSPWNLSAYNNTQNLLDGWMSATFIDALNGTTYGVFDPRIAYITDTTKQGTYKGTRNGAGRSGGGTTGDESYLSLNGFYSKTGAPLLLVTFAEMKFIEAEAAFATDKARAYQAYLDGIKANMDKLGVPEADRDAYLANPAVAVGQAAFTKDLVFKEKYVAMFLHPEAWTDARRHNYQYKDFALPANALLTSFIRRVGYPTTETSRNAENVPQVGSLADKLWWDQ
ncbi:SusD/RagB family nutrient-binding outer membrane lipoprotein [Foetidibacter luteolus]|uniref:SusD/RagB family nutrient-binding outer membrane lipoprotein n=1 Tax=Foetidibacter luteolus TaxID=2608880 RepID=UPI00129B3D86|nr:SusD/RagB family nutrient-binding outer membrane lipoprotein [Foetidibacter luteolus]